jgi:TfoX/Sxy family transcriptional regulator of competence genes
MNASPPELVELWSRVAPTAPDVVHRKMFGFPSIFVGGNLACGLFQDRIMARLADADRDEALTLAGAARLHDDPETLTDWLERAADFARSLPAKPARSVKKAKG